MHQVAVLIVPCMHLFVLVMLLQGVSTNGQDGTVDGLAESRPHLFNAQAYYDNAWSHGESEENRAVESSLNAWLDDLTPRVCLISEFALV